MADAQQESQRQGEGAAAAAAANQAQAGSRVRWDDSQLRTNYANVCNVASTREEVVVLFGINQAWHAGQREIPVQLSDRVILTPFAAKRLSLLLGGVLREYESRFGALPVETRPAGDASR
jgi:hypothetical protein